MRRGWWWWGGGGARIVKHFIITDMTIFIFFFLNLWQMSVVKWYQSLYDMSRLKSIFLQCYTLKAVSESCLTLCNTIQNSISPEVKRLYVHFPILVLAYDSHVALFPIVQELVLIIWLFTWHLWILRYIEEAWVFCSVQWWSIQNLQDKTSSAKEN